MLASPSARRHLITYVALLAISLLLLAFSGSGPLTSLRQGVGFALSPIQDSLRLATRNAASILSTLGEIDQLRQQNADLNAQVTELEARNEQLQAMAAQNEQLTQLLNVRSSLAYDSVAAEVASRRITEQERAVTLDRGTEVGIAVNDPVLGAGGALVGQVVEVGANYSRVLLISDSRMYVAGLLETSRAVGDIQGQSERPLVMTNIPATDVVEPGETVVTAGIELDQGIRSPYPKGLLIGSVVEVHRAPDQLFQTALITPAVPLDQLEYVLVITNYQGGLPALSPEPSDSPTP
jgi:rod shape-determining protein MreC